MTETKFRTGGPAAVGPTLLPSRATCCLRRLVADRMIAANLHGRPRHQRHYSEILACFAYVNGLLATNAEAVVSRLVRIVPSAAFGARAHDRHATTANDLPRREIELDEPL